jgi:osmotically inducible protein OsmC
MKIKRRGSAGWSGSLKEGKGEISTASGALKAYPYGFNSRFGDVQGSNPEELLGAAHSACFTMALSLVLGEAGLTADHLVTTAEVTLEQNDHGFSITAVHLNLKGKVPGVDAATFEKLAQGTKADCPVSKVLNVEITLEAELVG